jgi:hypothetical protein
MGGRPPEWEIVVIARPPQRERATPMTNGLLQLHLATATDDSRLRRGRKQS